MYKRQAEGLAQLIVNGNVPEILRNKRIISLSISSMLAGAKYRGEFEERLKKAIDEVQQHDDMIIFSDEIHTPGVNDDRVILNILNAIVHAVLARCV